MIARTWLRSRSGDVEENYCQAWTTGQRDVSEARKAYEEAFKIWNNADADLPLLVEARKEYEQLESGK